jgi:hypothetical protein
MKIQTTDIEPLLETAHEKLRNVYGDSVGAVEYLDWYGWPQTWPNSTCGFPGGLAMQAFFRAQTVMVQCGYGNACVVFIRGKFAYMVEDPTEAFETMLADLKVPGLGEFQREPGKYDAAAQDS